MREAACRQCAAKAGVVSQQSAGRMGLAVIQLVWGNGMIGIRSLEIKHEKV